MTVDRKHWMDDVAAVIRSRHYSWLPEGLGGEPVDVAMTFLLTDIRHVCQRAGISFEELLARSQEQFLNEEQSLAEEAAGES